MPIAELIEAIKANDLAALRGFLQREPRLADAKDETGVSAILLALYFGRREAASLLCEHRQAFSVHELAALGRAPDLLRELRQRPSALDSLSSDGWTPLHLAAFFGHAEAVRQLIAAGAKVNERSQNPMSNLPLHAAMVAGDVDVVKALLEAGAEVNAKQHAGYTALQAAAARGNLPVVELLLKHGADPAMVNDDGNTAKSLAEKKGHAAVAARV